MKVGDIVQVKLHIPERPSFGHIFQEGEVVEIVKEYKDGVFEVEGKWHYSTISQDVDPRDLEVL